DNENTATYDGHDLFNLRLNYPVSKRLEVYGRAMNLADERYATAASGAEGEQEFAPGAPRSFYAGLNVSF
ncbi:MAG TPA: TonB-dependent receptor, partial [Gammaproteobacteria bacterium]